MILLSAADQSWTLQWKCVMDTVLSRVVHRQSAAVFMPSDHFLRNGTAAVNYFLEKHAAQCFPPILFVCVRSWGRRRKRNTRRSPLWKVMDRIMTSSVLRPSSAKSGPSQEPPGGREPRWEISCCCEKRQGQTAISGSGRNENCWPHLIPPTHFQTCARFHRFPFQPSSVFRIENYKEECVIHLLRFCLFALGRHEPQLDCYGKNVSQQ